MDTGKKLREWLETEQMSQKDLAEKLGVSEATVSLFASGVRIASGGFMWRFARKYGLGITRMLFDSKSDGPTGT